MSSIIEDARGLYLEGNLADSLDICEKILGDEPGNAAALHLVGLLCYRGGDVPAAVEYFRECLRHAPDFGEAYVNLAVMLKTLGRVDESIEAYRQGLALDPNNAQAQYNFGLALQAAGRLADAAAALGQAVALSPYMADAHYVLGCVERDRGLLERSVSAFRNAIAAQPERVPTYEAMAAVLRRLGRLDEAVMVLRWAVTMHGLKAMGLGLAMALEDVGNLGEAEMLLARVVAENPVDAAAWEALGALRIVRGRYAQALDDLRQSVALDDCRASAHMRIYCVAQILRQPELALEHQGRALAVTRLFSESQADSTLPKLLILNAAGDWKANVPTDFIVLRDAWSAVHQYYVKTDGTDDLSGLPPCDVVFNAVAEPDVVRSAFAAAAAIVDSLGLPCVNDPRRVARTERQMVAAALAGLPSTVVPATYRLPRDGAAATVAALLADGALHLPLLVRPVGTHAGEGMVLARDAAVLEAALAGIASDELYVLQFVDYRAADGLYYKYRVVVVDGVAYPFHMALSKNWMVHYYNAELDDHAVMDRLEERFLADFPAVFAPNLQADLAEMGRRLGLDYFAVDCAIDDEGRLVLFEVDVGAVIHTLDDPRLYAYKHRYVPRIFDAVQAMLKARLR